MRHPIVAILTLLAFAASCTASGEEYLHIDEVTMRLEDENATFDLSFTLDTFSRIYVMALGCRYLEPELRCFLGGYADVKLVRADMEKASLHVTGAGKYNGGYYLFDSTPFGCDIKLPRREVARFSVVYPEGRTRTFYNVTATQNVFSQAKNPGPRGQAAE